MAYIKYKEVTKYFNFSDVIDVSKLPAYVSDYVYDEEIILAGYHTSRDHGIFTDKKIVLFDNTSTFGISKQVFTIPYKSISSIAVVYKPSGGELTCMLDSGYPLRLKFIKMDGKDKVRLRFLYSCICRIINSQPLHPTTVNRLINNDINFSKGGKDLNE